MQRLCETLFKCFFYPKNKAEKGEFGAINFCAVGPLLGSSFTLTEQRREYPYNSPPPLPSHRWLVIDISPLRCSRHTRTRNGTKDVCIYELASRLYSLLTFPFFLFIDEGNRQRFQT